MQRGVLKVVGGGWGEADSEVVEKGGDIGRGQDVRGGGLGWNKEGNELGRAKRLGSASS